MNKDNRTVDHLTRIILYLVDEPMPYDILTKDEPLSPVTVRRLASHLAQRLQRVAAMMELLAPRGFSFRQDKNCIYAESTEMEAQEAKRYLLANGFQDKEFQVWLEYTRKWGMM